MTMPQGQQEQPVKDITVVMAGVVVGTQVAVEVEPQPLALTFQVIMWAPRAVTAFNSISEGLLTLQLLEAAALAYRDQEPVGLTAEEQVTL
ncbi:hypothetical protein [Candidatus Aquiluna sp. UB-MaderosW2red]|uniref:hypothetical protein n=1 Tax=Candidatus Aquiluna sp. UB-MaderosW2red TaxID=1855377 RepID=UPI00201E472D|nr:hypothetical protein [Candidatus Aquiluna sp. UB-MaderosW2red]